MSEEKLQFKVWNYEEQTKMKHQVFKDYFDAWVKILGKYNHLNYIDGFGGIGAYQDDKGNIYYGSPIIAAKIIKENKKTAAIIVNDDNQENIENLKKIVNYLSLNDLPIQFESKKFDDSINQLLDGVSKDSKLAPTFFFVDPFGINIKYATIKRAMEVEKSEVLMNFMYNTIHRFLSLDKLDKVKTELFGSEDWKKLIELKGDHREEEVIKLYRAQLKKISKYVCFFKLEFPNKDRTYYYLVHMTNSLKGCIIMKSSFAKYNHGRVEYLGNRNAQMRLIDVNEVKQPAIEQHLMDLYNRQSKTYEKILEDLIDSTAYLESQISAALHSMEKKGQIYIDRFPKTTESKKLLRKAIVLSDIIYFNSFPTIERQNSLYKTKVEYGSYTINHVFGCAHGCNYPCYAMMIAKTYGKVKTSDDWLHPKIVGNTIELLDKELPKLKDQIPFVHLSFTTDPFMYDALNNRNYPAIQNLTLNIIKKINSFGIKCTVLTKGVYPNELISDKYSKENEYGITLVSLDKKFRREFEPYSAQFEERINALKCLHDNGLKTWVSIEPFPTPNTVPNSKTGQDLDKLLKKISFVNKIIFGKLNYNCVSKKFEHTEQFYKECSEKIIKFCKDNKIEYYIKEGTPGHLSSKRDIFIDEQ